MIAATTAEMVLIKKPIKYKIELTPSIDGTGENQGNTIVTTISTNIIALKIVILERVYELHEESNHLNQQLPLACLSLD